MDATTTLDLVEAWSVSAMVGGLIEYLIIRPIGRRRGGGYE